MKTALVLAFLAAHRREVHCVLLPNVGRRPQPLTALEEQQSSLRLSSTRDVVGALEARTTQSEKGSGLMGRWRPTALELGQSERDQILGRDHQA